MASHHYARDKLLAIGDFSKKSGPTWASLDCARDKLLAQMAFSKILWSHMGSNHGPSDYESDALTS